MHVYSDSGVLGDGTNDEVSIVRYANRGAANALGFAARRCAQLLRRGCEASAPLQSEAQQRAPGKVLRTSSGASNRRKPREIIREQITALNVRVDLT